MYVDFSSFIIFEKNYVKLMREMITVSQIKYGSATNNSNPQRNYRAELPLIFDVTQSSIF